ncbi:hypothetical protein QAD02_012859, partial [Eretmocerus hayati]
TVSPNIDQMNDRNMDGQTNGLELKRQLCGGNKQAIQRMLDFGRQLHSQSLELKQQNGKSENNKQMLRDAFSLLAYSNPWKSPVGWQLDPEQRETVCARLNSAIL